MSPTAPEVSVIIPVYNGEKYLAESIQSALAQEHAAIEILVVDNGSTDGTPSVAGAFPTIRYLRLQERGLAKALNRGVEQSGSRFVAFLDADDLWEPNKLIDVLIPSMKVSGDQAGTVPVRYLIAEVTYHLGLEGTHAELTLMAPEAFMPQPVLIQPQYGDVIGTVPQQ